MNCFEIFPSPIFSTKLEFDLVKLEDYCYNIHSKDTNGKIVSNRGGWQSQNMFVNDDHDQLILDVIAKINEISIDFTNLIGIKSSSISDYWININGKGHYNEIHDHPLCSIAGVYYIKTPPNCGDIMFEHPAERIMRREWSDTMRWTHYSSWGWQMSTEANYIYLFPSWLRHSVLPNESDEDRISISFNLE